MFTKFDFILAHIGVGFLFFVFFCCAVFGDYQKPKEDNKPLPVLKEDIYIFLDGKLKGVKKERERKSN